MAHKVNLQRIVRWCIMAAPVLVTALAWAGGKDLGKPCKQNSDCKSNTCNLARSPKRCVPANNTGKPGDFCNDERQCYGKLVCHHETSKCSAPYKKSGDQCQTLRVKVLPGMDGMSKDPCTGVCDNNVKKCVPNAGHGKLGEYCINDNQCVSNFCSGYTCKKTPPKRQPHGTACSTNDQCSGVCDHDMCAPKAPQNKGGYCRYDQHCKQPLICYVLAPEGELDTYYKQYNVNRCMEPPLANGKRCNVKWNPRNPCSGGICDPARKKCVPNNGTGKKGQYCTNDAQCDSKRCSHSKCKAQEQVGEACEKNSDCSSMVCDLAQGNPRKCIPANGKGNKGQYCSHNNQCRPGTTCKLLSGKRYGKCG